MFTGIIDHCGIITQLTTLSKRLKVGITHSFTSPLELGESIAINGICLTVTHFYDNVFYCDISPETLKLTTASQFKIGQRVNLERALQLSSRLGGHFVMGHVDQVAFIKKIQQIEDFVEMTLEGLDEKFLVKKGSIAVNGVSLTINDIQKDSLSLMLIPHTLQRTQLGDCRLQDSVNIEFDILARIMAKQLEKNAHESICFN